MKKQTQLKLEGVIRKILKESSSNDKLMALAKQWVSLVSSRKPSQQQLLQTDKIGAILAKYGILEKNTDYDASTPGDIKYHWIGNVPPEYQLISDYIESQIT